MVKQYKAMMGVVENTEHSPSPHNAGVEEMWAVANLDHRAKIGIVHKQLNFTQHRRRLRAAAVDTLLSIIKFSKLSA